MTPDHRVPPRLPGLGYVQPLGAGGYADVYLYEQQAPERHVVVKALRDPESPPAARRLANEADAMVRLAGHPHVVHLLRVDASADGRPCLVMEYCPPPNLAVRACRQRFALWDVLRTGIELAGAVESAHRAGVVHRDIKPANIVVSRSGDLALADWGTARCGSTTDNHEGDLGVSVPWAAPELLFGPSDGDAASDVYSIAATLWQLLAGHSPFVVPGGDNTAYALTDRIGNRPAPGTGRADVPDALELLLARALDRDPAVRPSTAAEFARALQAVESGQGLPCTALDAPGTPLPGGTRIAAAPQTPLVDTSPRRSIAVPAGA